MSNKKRVPKDAVVRKVEKSVRVHEQTNDGKPVWRFSTVDLGGPFKWPKSEQTELEIVSKLHGFDSMTWHGQDGIEGKQHHFLSQSSLSKEAKQRLIDIKKDDDIDNLFSFHLQGQPRIIAVRHQNVAKLLWYDPEHKVVPSTLQRT